VRELGPLCYVNRTDNYGTGLGYNSTTQEQANISTHASDSQGKKVNESEEFDKGT
jgi:hypothetical protein